MRDTTDAVSDPSRKVGGVARSIAFTIDAACDAALFVHYPVRTSKVTSSGRLVEGGH
jgi:hypothetical protein